MYTYMVDDDAAISPILGHIEANPHDTNSTLNHAKHHFLISASFLRKKNHQLEWKKVFYGAFFITRACSMTYFFDKVESSHLVLWEKARHVQTASVGSDCLHYHILLNPLQSSLGSFLLE